MSLQISDLRRRVMKRYHASNNSDESLPVNGEPKKVVVTASTWTAFRRCFFHLIPIATSITIIIIIIINLRGVFIGYDLSGVVKSETINLMFLQLAAKAHEILIVASLGMVILQVVRHELLFGDGLPLGLIGSGLSFSDFSWFFRAEFYGSLKYLATHGKKTRKLGLIILLIVTGLIAALAGPSSAVLLVPRSQEWPSAHTNVFLNGTAEDLWPSDLSGALRGLSQVCASNNSSELAVCPAGGFASLRDHWSRINASTFFNQNIPPYTRLLSGSLFYWPVNSPKNLIPPLYALGDARKSVAIQDKTTLVQPLAAASVVLQQTASDWWEAMTRQKDMDREKIDALIDDRQVRANSQSAIATVRCAAAQDLSTTSTTVEFPTIPFWFEYGDSSSLEVKELDVTPVNHLQFQWVQLPGRFGPASVGGVFQSSWAANNSSRIVVGCTAQAGWVPSSVRTDSYSFWSGWYPWNITFGARVPRYVEAPHDEFLSATNGRIALGKTWLDLLTPSVPVEGTLAAQWQPTTIESILIGAGFDQKTSNDKDASRLSWWAETGLPKQGNTPFLEAIVSSVLVDGISRSGSYHVFDIEGPASGWHLRSHDPLPGFANRILSGKEAFKAPNESKDLFSTMAVTMNITGYALRRSLSAYLAMSVLLSHAIIATLNIIWTLFNRQTSRSWSSVVELIALAQNSTPAFGTLANTAAGIERASTFAKLAKIRVRAQPGSSQRDHVELVVEDDSTSLALTSNGKPASRRHSDRASDARPTSLLLGNNASDGTRRARGSATWPNDPHKLSVHPEDTELRGRSDSTERLIPPVHLVDEDRGDVVRVNRSYR